jgi:4-amino-4-deoxy-L-arabinose transferase-like glycosyltransferase
MSRTAATLILLVILIAYLAIGAAYAISTPPWQSPDEPAHYNFIKYIAEHKSLPILEPGDYDQKYNEEFTRTPKNTHSMLIDPLRYENYAPPLYYLLAAPLYALTDGWIVALRLFSVMLGGALVVVAYRIGVEMFPLKLPIALGTAAFVAFVPQHLTMMSAVNNDALAELLIALCVWQSMRLFRSKNLAQWSLFTLGMTLGLGLLTKATVYYTAVPIVFIALTLHARRYTLHASHYALVFVPALTLGALFWIRNMGVYGGFDVLGLARHNAVVVGQPTTAQWIADYGFGGLLSRGLTTTFQSFWGQFGWMAVPMPVSTYLILGALSLAALIGWIWWLIERGKVQGAQRIGPQAIILALLAFLTFAGFIWYNFTFVQHQGRYLFPALIPIGMVSALGLDQWLSKIKSIIARLTSRSKRDLTPWLDEAHLLAFALVFIFLARLDIIALQRYIIPNLTP